MKLYKIVRYCKICKKRFFVQNQKYSSYFCEDCNKKYKKAQEEEERSKESDEKSAAKE
ncbi:hypothetical protein ACFL0W_05380 [Nanoarchaeota archaeon]